jgi:hypothetical protein
MKTSHVIIELLSIYKELIIKFIIKKQALKINYINGREF